VAGVMLAAAPNNAFVLNTEAAVWDIAARDITGDSRAEIFAVCCDEQSAPLVKFVDVFVADASGGYPAQPSSRVDLDPSLSALFFAETDGAPPVELVAADAEGAVVFRYAEGRFARADAPRFSSLLPSNAKEPAFLKDAVQDLDGDGIDEWIIPAPSGYEVRKTDGRIYKIPCDVVSEFHANDSLYIFHRLSSCNTFSLEGSTQKGLAFLSDAFADFAYGVDWSQHQRFKIPLNLEEKWEASTRMADIDGNGFPDLVVTQMKGTINLKAVTQVYLATAPFVYPATPSATFEANGALTSPSLVDVDGDGKQDLVFVSIPFGVRNIINFLVRRKLSVHVAVYLFKDGRFPAKPTFAENVLLDAPEGRERVAYTLGDFNGDGRMDVAFGEGSDKLAIRTGSADQFISPHPWVTLSVPAFGIARPVDLNGNKSKDLVMFHPGGANRRRVDVIVF
jgi:hypothetical protein